jgi:hypothetical protein
MPNKNPIVNRERAKAWAKAHPERTAEISRKYLLKKRFSKEMTPELFQQMFDNQGGKCAICRNIPLGKRLSIDHNHENGTIRGLLCNGCNMAMGGVKENIVTLLRMVDYINDNLNIAR